MPLLFDIQAWDKQMSTNSWRAKRTITRQVPWCTGRLIAMVGITDQANQGTKALQVLFGLVLTITPRTTKNKNELPAARIHRQCNPKAIEVAFLSVPAIEFFADEQLQVPQEWYLEQGQGLEAFDAAVRDDKGPLPATFLLHDIWILGCTKPTSEVAAVAQTVVQVPVGTRNLKCSQIPCPLPTHVQPLGAG